jgi:hypothetical protein
MKKYLLALCFVSSLSFAKSLAWMPNQAGGKIIITDEICQSNGKTFKSLNRAFLYTQSGFTLEGCFYIEEELISVVWSDGTQMKYEIKNFILYSASKNNSI